MKSRRLLRRFVPDPLRRPARAVIAIVTLPLRLVLGYVRNRIPSPRTLWPDTKGLEAVLLAAVLALLRFQHRLLQGLALNSRNLRRFRGKTIVGHPLKVLHVTCSFDLGGTQRQIMQLCEFQDAASFLHDAIEIFPEQNYLYRRDVRLQPGRYIGHTLVSRIMWRLTQNQGTRSAQVVQLYKLARDFRALRPDIVVGWGHEICMLTFLGAAIARVPHIVFCIRTFNPAFGWTTAAMGKLLRSSHQRMQPLLSGIITNSTPLREDYGSWLEIAANQIQVCPNGIKVMSTTSEPADRSAVRRRFDIPAEALVLLNVGRFSPEKGQMLMMRANERLVARYGVRAPICLLCGDGPLLPDVRRFVEERALGNVRFAGRIDNVDAYLSASDVFVMPSDFEGMPNAMMEAMGHGLPCVSTDRTGALDIARDGIEALYCPTGADDKLADQLFVLIDNPDERRRLGANARERIKEFSVEQMAKRFNACLETMVRESPVPMTVRDGPPREAAGLTVKPGSQRAD